MSTSPSSCPIPPVPVEVYAKLLCELFTNVWDSCCDSDEAAELLGFSHDAVLSWAAHYRAAGIQLKELPRKEGRMAYIVQQVVRSIATKRRRPTRRQRSA